MMTPQVYKEMIVSGIQDLPPALLAEVANFVYFVRKQVDDPDAFAVEQYSLLLNKSLEQLKSNELFHLEAEFADYEQQFPRKQ
jgi:hypothetical protein